jgi:hypothetical protein
MCIFEPVIARWAIIGSEAEAFGYAPKALLGSIAFTVAATNATPGGQNASSGLSLLEDVAK